MTYDEAASYITTTLGAGWTIAIEQDVRDLFQAAGMVSDHWMVAGDRFAPTTMEDTTLCIALGMTSCSGFNLPFIGRLITPTFTPMAHDTVDLRIFPGISNTDNTETSFFSPGALDTTSGEDTFTWVYKDIATTPTNLNHLTTLVFAMGLMLAMGLGRKPKSKLVQ